MLNLTLTTTTRGAVVLNETEQYLVDVHGYNADIFLGCDLEVTITGDAADLARLVEECDATLLPITDELGVSFFTNADLLARVAELVATL